MQNSFFGNSDLWMLEGIAPRARDAAVSAAERQQQTLGEWMTQAICDHIEHEPQPACPCRSPDPMISEADSTAYQSELTKQRSARSELVRTINDHDVCLPGNPGDASAEPPRFD